MINAHDARIRLRLSHLLDIERFPEPVNVNQRIHRLVIRARRAFLLGYRQALGAPPESLPGLLRDIPIHSRGFAIEGAAMVLTMKDEYESVDTTLLVDFLDGRSTEEQTLGAIGVGWASARMGKPHGWIPDLLQDCFLSAVSDGYGFHQGFFHPLRYERRGFPGGRGKLSMHYDIGLGRALWFIQSGRAETIARTISVFLPSRRVHLWRGIGVACAFAGGNLDMEKTREVAAEYAEDFNSGMVSGSRLRHALESQQEITS